MSYCLLNYKNNFLSILIVNSDVLKQHSSNVFDYNPQWKEQLSLLPVSVLGETTHRVRLWSGSWKMKRTLLDEWGDSCFPGGGSKDKGLGAESLQNSCEHGGQTEKGGDMDGEVSQSKKSLWHVKSLRLHLEIIGSISLYKIVLMILKTSVKYKAMNQCDPCKEVNN